MAMRSSFLARIRALFSINNNAIVLLIIMTMTARMDGIQSALQQVFLEHLTIRRLLFPES